MSTVAKILVVLNLLLAGYFLSSASTFLANQDDFQQKLTAEKTDHQTTKTTTGEEIGTLRSRLNTADANLTESKNKYNALDAKTSAMSQELTQLRGAYNSLSANHTRAQRTVDQLTNSLASARKMNAALQGDNNNLRDNLKSAQDDRDAKVAQVNALQQQLSNETEKGKSLESKLASAAEKIKRQGFELGYIKKKFPGIIASDQPAHSGKILASNNKDNVYVMSLGEEDGVESGFQYIVSRGSEYIATIQITDVQAKQSAGRAIKSLSKGAINRGDKVMNGN